MFDFNYDKLNDYFQERYDCLSSNYNHYKDDFLNNHSDVYLGLVMVSSSLFELICLCYASRESLSYWGRMFADLRFSVDTLAVSVLVHKEFNL